MMRINLLPPEILERRRAEKGIGYVIVGAIAVALVLAATWGFAYMGLQGKKDDLAAIQQQVQVTQAEAAQLAIFEERAAELDTRRTTAASALAGRQNWGKLADEISLVLPTDMWLQSLAFSGDTVTFNGTAIDVDGDSPDIGHRTIAKLLVRMADLEQLYNVWLTSSTKGELEQRPVINFAVTADVHPPADEGGAQ
jgi:Tfp pilus assembly protein PilN